MLHVIYRSYGGENMKGRPDYYDKLLALASLVRSFDEIETGSAELVFLNDGPIPADRLRLMQRSGEVIARSDLGLLGSLRTGRVLAGSRGWPRDDLVWFSEDDYLYLPAALGNLIDAAAAWPDASYFGLYALIGSRLPSGKRFEDDLRVPKRWRDSEARNVRGHPWRRALSTTSTFGARVGALADDQAMMRLMMRSGGAFDHTTCLIYQGYAPHPLGALVRSFRDPGSTTSLSRRLGALHLRMALNVYQAARSRRPSARRVLVSADPALITHLETEYMAAGTDWRAVADETRAWMRSQLAHV